jgi:hypothetical protein
VLSIFLGAGFSKWAANLPVARELFDFNIEPWGPKERKKFSVVKALKQKWDATHPNEYSEKFIAEALTYSKTERENVLWYIVRRFSEPFIWREFHAGQWRRHILMIDEQRAVDLPGVIKAQRFLDKCISLDTSGIITSNYDMLIEYSLGIKGFNYGIPDQLLYGRGAYPMVSFHYPVRLQGYTPVAKIHGSVNRDSLTFYSEGRRGLTGNALIVAPTPEKRPPKELGFDWMLADTILRRSTKLLVFGFAFNPYDEALLTLLKDAGKNLQSVLLVNPHSKVEQAKKLWSSADIIACSPPPEDNSVLDHWLAI